MKKLLYIALILGLVGLWSCVEDDVYDGPASITNIAITPASPTELDPVVVSATISGVRAVTSAAVNYKVGSGSYTAVAMAKGASDVWSATIPAQAKDAVVSYYITAENGGTTAKSADKTYTVGAPSYLGLVLNEVDGNSKAVELFNSGTFALPLTGVSLIKDNAVDAWWTGVAASGSIAPGAYILIIQDNPNDPNLSGNGGISMKKDVKFELKSPTGESLGTMTRTGTTDYAGQSFQRCPNGTGAWKLAAPTNGAANPATGTDVVSPNTLQ